MANYLNDHGFTDIKVNNDLTSNPQIVACRKGRLCFVIVRTALYPHQGQLDDDRLFKQLVEQADQYNAYCYFSGVGIANADGKNAQEKALPVRGGAYHASFDGLKIMTLAERVTVLKSGSPAADPVPLSSNPQSPGQVSATEIF